MTPRELFEREVRMFHFRDAKLRYSRRVDAFGLDLCLIVYTHKLDGLDLCWRFSLAQNGRVVTGGILEAP